jgi:hypothetical protein
MNTVIRKSSDKYSPTEEELERIRAISDEEIDFSDAPETDAEFWATAKKFSPTNRMRQRPKWYSDRQQRKSLGKRNFRIVRTKTKT